MSISVSYRREFCAILCLAALVCLPWLGRPFHTRGEPREALVAQAMLVSGNWISPETYDHAVPSKPPFSHWLMALLSLPGGEVTELTARLPSALAFLSFVGMVFVFVSRRANASVAITACLILVTMSEWFRSAATCRVDMLLATSMAGGMLALYSWWEGGFRRIPWLAIALLSCATLTKGPVGFVVPLGIFSLFCWLRSEFRMNALPTIVLRGLALSVPVIAIASVWYILGYLERGDAFIEKIRYENFDRFTSSMEDKPHNHSTLYLLGMLALGVLPWTVCWAVELGCRVIVGRSLAHGTRLSAVKDSWRRLPSLYQYAMLVSGIVLLFFCIPSSKRAVYLLPAYPFISLLIAYWVQTPRQYAMKSAVVTKRIVECGAAIVLLLAAVLFLTPIGGFELRWNALVASVSVWKVLVLLVLVALLAGPLRSVVRDWYQRPIEGLGLAVIGAICFGSLFVYDAVAWQLSAKEWSRSGEFKERVSAISNDTPCYSYGSEMYGASFYLGRPFERVTENLPSREILVMLEAKRLDEFRRKIAPHAVELFRYRSGLEDARRDIVVVHVVPTGASR
jgi:4-amino-4-deoxy-L-arabinose transferase-like glycosyltransferase